MGNKMPLFCLNPHRLSKVNECLQKLYGRELPSTICKGSKKPVTGEKKYCEITQLFRSQFIAVSILTIALNSTGVVFMCFNQRIKEERNHWKYYHFSISVDDFQWVSVSNRLNWTHFLGYWTKRTGSKWPFNCFVTENNIPEGVFFSFQKTFWPVCNHFS